MDEIDVKSVKTKNRTSNGWSMLATAILRDAVKYGDVDFLESEWCEDVVYEIANINDNISLNKLKEIAYEIYNKTCSEIEESDIFNI